MRARARWMAAVGLVTSLGVAALLHGALTPERASPREGDGGEHPLTAVRPTPSPARPEAAPSRGGGPAPSPVELKAPTTEGQGQVTVRVLDETGSRTLSGARVAIIRGSRTESWSEATTSDDSGAAVFAQAHAGLFEVCARGANHGLACETNVGLVAGGELRVELRLPKGGNLEGQVFLPDGSPAQGAMMRVGDEADLSAWTDAEGRYRISGLSNGPHYVHLVRAQPRDGIARCGSTPPFYDRLRFDGSAFVVPFQEGEATLYAWTEDGQAGSITVTGTQKSRVEVNIVLKNTGGITGTVDATALKPEYAFGGLVSLDDRWPPPTQVVYPDGRFFVAGLEPGEHSMRVKSRHGAPLRVLITEGRLTNLGNVSQPDRPELDP